ncbi:hypothetical protein HN587_06375 [Candidatus Woesearchaeota archaeon]|jgi:RNase P/RNase MRP subunit p30|nr:hypothetical protein [Candidatus Woesearchaeota archaeon]
MIDFVKPNGNEQELILFAEKLGYQSLCLVYDKFEDISKFSSKIELKLGVVVDKSKKIKGVDYIIYQSQNPDIDRVVIERGEIDFIIGLEDTRNKDFMHNRASGVNQVISKLLLEKKVKLLVNFGLILGSKGYIRSLYLGRIKQNLKFCNKYGFEVRIASFAKQSYQMRDYSSLVNFLKLLGLDTQKVKNLLRPTDL